MSLFPIIFFLACRLCCRANFIFAAGLTYPGCQRLFMRGFRFTRGFAAVFGLRPNTREKTSGTQGRSHVDRSWSWPVLGILINYFLSFLFLTGFISDAIQFKHFLWLRFEDHDVYMMNLYWKEFAPLFSRVRECTLNKLFYLCYLSVQWFRIT